MHPLITLCSAAAILSLTACSKPVPVASTTPATNAPPMIGMANPASAHCVELGGRLDIRTGKDGGQYGMCTLPDGRTCEEWALFREHQCKTHDDK